MGRMNPDAFNRMLERLQEHYRLYGPVKKSGGGAFSDTDLIGYGEIKHLDDLILDTKSYFSPKELFYPVRETLFQFAGGQTLVPALDTREIIIFARPCDINGVDRLDQIFLHNGTAPDFYYARRRQKIHFFMVECLEGFDSCFCVDMNSNRAENWAAAFRFGGDVISCAVKDPHFKPLIEHHPDVETSSFEPDYIKKNNTRVEVPMVGSVLPEHFDHPVWKSYTERCIACGRCNTSCITCSCFTMQDVTHSVSDTGASFSGERRRRWASCHVNGYTDMAGGHSFRKKNGERMRFKTLHKISDFHKRFGSHMCVGCGRCDDVCPEYISFSKCINKLSETISSSSEGGPR